MLRRLWALVSVVFFTVLATATAALAYQPPASPDGFVPVDTLPPAEQLPAGPFLVGAYVFFLLLMMFYLWTIWRRLGQVEREMRDLERRSHGGPVR